MRRPLKDKRPVGPITRSSNNINVNTNASNGSCRLFASAKLADRSMVKSIDETSSSTEKELVDDVKQIAENRTSAINANVTIDEIFVEPFNGYVEIVFNESKVVDEDRSGVHSISSLERVATGAVIPLKSEITAEYESFEIGCK